MATKKKEAEKISVTDESVYTAEELAKNHRVLNTCYAIVKIALKLANVESATLAEASTIIEKFKNKEVK